jgi:hypothetical protein
MHTKAFPKILAGVATQYTDDKKTLLIAQKGFFVSNFRYLKKKSCMKIAFENSTSQRVLALPVLT